MYPFGFQFNSVSLFTYLNFPVWASVRRETFWFVLLTLYLYYCLEWKQSVSARRISGNLAPHSKSLTLFKIYCLHNDARAQPVSSFSTFSPSPSFLPSTLTCLLSLAYISICPTAGLGKKGLHEQALCHSGRVHQRAECSGWSGLLWREDKEVSRKPSPQLLARFALLQCVSALPGCPASFVRLTEYKLVLLPGNAASGDTQPWDEHTVCLSFHRSFTLYDLIYILI